MGQFLELLILVIAGLLLWKAIVRGIQLYRATRPLRDAHKAYKQARNQYRRQQEQAQNTYTRRKRREGKSFIKEYAEDVEYVEIAETKTSAGSSKTTTQQTVVESQVTDVEWEEVKK